MHILQIVSHYPPAYHYGGVLHVAHSLAKELQAQGHRVRVCTSNLADPQHVLDRNGNKWYTVDRVEVNYSPVVLSRYWGISPAMARRLWREAVWADVILIHFHYQFASLIGGWIARLRRKPYIIFTHGSLNHYGVANRSRTRKQLYLNLLERRNFEQALFVAYHSQEEMDNSFQWGRCQVVANGIDPEVFGQLPPAGTFRRRYPKLDGKVVYLYLGRLDEGKGLDLLLPAFRQLANERLHVQLVLAGGNERSYEATLRQMVVDLALSDQVTFTGLISGDDKLSALQDADVCVLPSRSEGLSIAMLEAMYMGLPVVVSDHVGLWRTIEAEQCGLVVPLDVTRLAVALRELADNPQRRQWGQRGHELVQRGYTWPVIARGLMERIEESLEHGSP